MCRNDAECGPCGGYRRKKPPSSGSGVVGREKGGTAAVRQFIIVYAENGESIQKTVFWGCRFKPRPVGCESRDVSGSGRFVNRGVTGLQRGTFFPAGHIAYN